MSILPLLFPVLKVKKRKDRFTALDSEAILNTIDRLDRRIRDRFPDSGLSKVCVEFKQLSLESSDLARSLERPIWIVRILASLTTVVLLGLVLWALSQVVTHFSLTAAGVYDLLQTTESAINELIFLGLAIFFLVGLETRLKRRSSLEALHRLRSIAHVVDMHQLTKDPAFLFGNITTTKASPERTLTRFELTRYLDYCSELLALVSKIAALFAQNMDDPIVLNAVNDLESLTQGLSGKIWQKIMILDLAQPSATNMNQNSADRTIPQSTAATADQKSTSD
jgi:hypothetical protein